MSRLEVKRLDSPLARSSTQRADPAKGAQEREEQPETSSQSKPRRTVERSKTKLASVPQMPPDMTAAGSDPLERLPDPPALNEPLELLSTRLPSSIRRSLSEFTAALRTRDGGRASQKSLPEQEVLAVLVWLAGSAQDPQATTRLGDALDAYRARRYAAAAKALRPSAPAGESP